MFKDYTKIHQALEDRFGNEDGLTINMMRRAISDLEIVDPEALDIIYESVIFYTGDWPEHEGWGSSDSAICVRSVKESLINNGYLKETVMSPRADVANEGRTVKFQTGHTEAFIRNQWGSAYTDTKGILRWCINDQIPFQDMLADFRALGLIDEDVQLGSSLLREKEDEEFWATHDITKPKEK